MKQAPKKRKTSYSSMRRIANALGFRLQVGQHPHRQAIAMEAREGGDGEARLHAQHDSAGRDGIAQPPPEDI